MGTTDANGIYMYDDTDPLVPLQALLNTGQASVSSALDAVKTGLIHYVANTAERTALAATYQPTASKPLYVHRGDAAEGIRLEVSTNGSDWRSIVRSRVILEGTNTQTTFSTSDTLLTAFGTMTATTALGGVRATFPATLSGGAANQLLHINVNVDGTRMGQGQILMPIIGGPGQQTVSFTTPRIAVANGSHTFTVRGRVISGGGTGTILANAALVVEDVAE